MKVVINTCFGGFSISNVALEKILQRKGIAYEKTPVKHKFFFKTQDNEFDYWKAGQVGDDDAYLSSYNFHDDRTDVDLIAVIEEMGEASFGWAADLKIVEVPDDVKWHIDEYDGREYVAEDHRTWN